MRHVGAGHAQPLRAIQTPATWFVAGVSVIYREHSGGNAPQILTRKDAVGEQKPDVQKDRER